MGIGPGNIFALNRRQSITWSNADPVQWRNAALGGDELKNNDFAYIIHSFQ